MFRSKITELIIGEFLSGSSLQDFVHRISIRVIGSVNSKVFSVILWARKLIKLIHLEYSPVMIRSRIAGNNSLRNFSGR